MVRSVLSHYSPLLLPALLSLGLALLTCAPRSVSAEAEPISASPGISNCAFPDFSALAKLLSPSVVNVSVDGSVKAEAEPGEKGGKEKDEDPRKDPDSPFKSVGSGFIIEASGYIVTNYHVVGTSEDGCRERV